MDMKDKQILMNAVLAIDVHNDFTKFLKIFNQYGLLEDESFFDYQLLKAALGRKNKTIAYFFIKIGCRASNPHKGYWEESPLHLAMNSHFDVFYLTMMLNNGASIYDKNLKGETPLHAAFKANEYEALDTALDYISNNFTYLNSDNKYDILHFHIACIRNHTKSVEAYLQVGFDVNKFFTIEFAELVGSNPLHYAISKGYCDLFKMLLIHGGDLSIKNHKGLTPLHIFYYKYYKFHYNNLDLEYQSSILFSCRDEMIQTFNFGNDTKFINSVDTNGVSHFHIYCLTSQHNFVQELIDIGEDVNHCIASNLSVNAGFTPLHFAVENDCIEIVELLLKSGADCNKANKEGVTPLYMTCKKCTIDVDEKITKSTSTHLAINQTRIEIIEMLLKNGADCNRLDKKGITLLRLIHENCKAPEKFKIIKLLLDYKACPTEVDKKRNTLIHLVFQKASYYLNSEAEIVFDKMMSKIPLGVNITNDEGISLFHIACTRNNIYQVIQFLDSGVKIDSWVVSGKYRGYTALHFAVLFNQKDIIKVLLKRNAQINIKTSKSIVTPLHVACEYRWIKYYKLANLTDDLTNCAWTNNHKNQLEIIKLLLLHGAAVDAKDSSGLTPLLQACVINENNYAISDWPDSFKVILINEINTIVREIIKILLSIKAHVNTCTNQLSTILHIISRSKFLKNSQDLVELFITSGADVDATDDAGLTPLHVAVEHNKSEVVRSLLKHKANINIQCKNNRTPVHIAMHEWKVSYEPTGFSKVDLFNLYNPNDICNILLINCSDINVKNENGRTLLHDAIQNENSVLIKRLLYFGADINEEDSNGDSTVCNCSKNLEIIFNHVQKLSALGFYVSQKVQTVCNEIYIYHKKNATLDDNNIRNLDNIYDECIEELNQMKLIMLDNYTSLYDILLKDQQELSTHVKNDTLINMLEGMDIDVEFPFYSYLLKLQFRRGVARSDILESAKTSSFSLFGLNLPDSCLDTILKFLTNEEITNLIEAVEMKSSCKSKSNESKTNRREISNMSLRSFMSCNLY